MTAPPATRVFTDAQWAEAFNKAKAAVSTSSSSPSTSAVAQVMLGPNRAASAPASGSSPHSRAQPLTWACTQQKLLDGCARLGLPAWVATV